MTKEDLAFLKELESVLEIAIEDNHTVFYDSQVSMSSEEHEKHDKRIKDCIAKLHELG